MMFGSKKRRRLREEREAEEARVAKIRSDFQIEYHIQLARERKKRMKFYDDYYRLDYKASIRKDIVKRHKISDLAAKVCAIPTLSSPRVVGQFVDKLVSESYDQVTVAEENVIKVVDNWPNACQDGRDKFLADCGIVRPTPLASILVKMQYVSGAERVGNLAVAELSPQMPGVKSAKRIDRYGEYGWSFEYGWSDVELTLIDPIAFLAWARSLKFEKHLKGGYSGIVVKGELKLTSS